MATNVESVIEKVRGGDLDAYAEVIRRCQDDIRRIVAFAMRDIDTTEDLVQQSFVDAYTGLDKFTPGRDFGAWLRTIARNLVRKEIRRAGREGRKLRSYHAHLMERFEDTAVAEEHERRLRDALSGCRQRLSPSAAKLIDLRYAKSLGFEDVARAIGRTVQATRQMLWRVRAALRKCVEERTVQS